MDLASQQSWFTFRKTSTSKRFGVSLDLVFVIMYSHVLEEPPKHSPSSARARRWRRSRHDTLVCGGDIWSIVATRQRCAKGPPIWVRRRTYTSRAAVTRLYVSTRQPQSVTRECAEP